MTWTHFINICPQANRDRLWTLHFFACGRKAAASKHLKQKTSFHPLMACFYAYNCGFICPDLDKRVSPSQYNKRNYTGLLSVCSSGAENFAEEHRKTTNWQFQHDCAAEWHVIGRHQPIATARQVAYYLLVQVLRVMRVRGDKVLCGVRKSTWVVTGLWHQRHHVMSHFELFVNVVTYTVMTYRTC